MPPEPKGWVSSSSFGSSRSIYLRGPSPSTGGGGGAVAFLCRFCIAAVAVVTGRPTDRRDISSLDPKVDRRATPSSILDPVSFSGRWDGRQANVVVSSGHCPLGLSETVFDSLSHGYDHFIKTTYLVCLVVSVGADNLCIRTSAYSSPPFKLHFYFLPLNFYNFCLSKWF